MSDTKLLTIIIFSETILQHTEETTTVFLYSSGHACHDIIESVSTLARDTHAIISIAIFVVVVFIVIVLTIFALPTYLYE